MRCALIFYFVVTIFVVVHGVPDLCVFKDYEGKAALCGRHDVEHTFDFIPAISQNISYIDLLEMPLKQLPYNAFRNLSSQSSISRIRLQNCHISHVDAGALLYLHNLSNIDLSHNNIKQIDSKLFIDTKRIKFIYMEYNKIEILPKGLFQNLLQLEVVYLHHNQIRQVEWFLFKNTPSLQIIYLNNNQMEFINMSFKDKFDNLSTLSLYGNPWNCNCEIGPLYDFFIKFNRFNLHELACKEPSTLQGKKWSDISRDKFVCHSEESVVTSTEPMTTTEQDDNIPVTLYRRSTLPIIVKRRSYRRINAQNMDSGLPMRVVQSSAVSESGVFANQDSVMISIESMTSTEINDNMPVSIYNGMRYQQVDSGIPQSPLILNWILYLILGLVLMCVTVVIVGVVFVVRHTLATTNRRRHARLPTIIKRSSDRRTRAPVRVSENGAVSENGDSGLNTDEDVEAELTSIHHYEIRESTIN